MKIKKIIVARLKSLSNLDYCQSAEDCQNALEKINDLLNDVFPEVAEEEEDPNDTFENA